MEVEVVVGANYGDEGKGLFTEHLCRNMPKPAVVLSNGGCQRGHTVNNKELGIRHVFHHFGSGTLLNAPSVYAKTFIVNPIKYAEEKKELELHRIEPIALRAPGCILQLPGDMFTNQMLELARAKDNARHGSCGWGIWETQVRNAELGKLSFEDFSMLSYSKKRQMILDAVDWQLETRLSTCKDTIYTYLLDTVRSDNFIKHFIYDFEEMAKTVKCLETDSIVEVNWTKHNAAIESLVIENAQGLLLDKDYAPEDENGRTDVHTTPSKCGLASSIEALGYGADACSITANYITRTYLTRHGAGPFPEEDKDMHFEDKTNVPNDWQGMLRFGQLDDEAVVKLLARVDHDSACAKKRNVIVTHCNEIEPCTMLKDNAAAFSYEDSSCYFLKK